MVSSITYFDAPISNPFQQLTYYMLSASRNSHRPLTVIENIQSYQDGTGLPRVQQARVSFRQILCTLEQARKEISYYHKNSYYLVLIVAFPTGAFLPFCWSIGQDTAVIYEEDSGFSRKTAADSIW